MAVYATAAELEVYVGDNPDVHLPTGEEAVERLLERAERQVDLVVGPWPRFSNGLKFDPAQLDATQRAALSRATCAAAEWLLLVDPSTLAGDDDWVPSQVTVLRRARHVAPKMEQELAGHGLVKRSGTVVTPAAVTPPPP